MLFDSRQFELHFKESALLQGMKQFVRGQVELLWSHGSSEFKFTVGQLELHLLKKGYKLVSYNCTCNNGEYCLHLAAALFFLQQDTLGLSAKSKINQKSKPAKLPATIGYPELLFFLEGEKVEAEKHLAVPALLMNTSEENSFVNLRFLFGTLLKPLYKTGKLNQEQIDTTTTQLNSLINKMKALLQIENPAYYIYLALLCELQALMQVRLTGHEYALLELLNTCYQKLDDQFRNGLTLTQKLAWQQAFYDSVKNNTIIRTGSFSFLLPRLLCWTKNKADIDCLKMMLDKRKYKMFYNNRIDNLLVAKLQISLREQEFATSKIPPQHSAYPVESTFAAAGLDFCRNKTERAFNLLDVNYHLITNTYKGFFDTYTAYIVEMAKVYKRPDMEIKYLHERLLKGLYMLPLDFERYMELLKQNKQEEKINQLIESIRDNATYYSFDKLSVIYQYLGKTDELIYEIKKQNGNYRLLHELLLKKLPLFNQAMLKLYATRFIEAMADVRIYHHQQQLFDTARQFIDKLPDDARDMVLDKLITHAGSESQLSRHIRRLYRI